MTNINNNVSIQFIRGEEEIDQPEVRLYRNIDGKKGQAIYKFYNPSTITLENFKSIQEMYLIDEEGELKTRKIDLTISKEHVKEVKSIFYWNSEKEFERFMRFAERYAKSNTN